jgi:hypothetical protein
MPRATGLSCGRISLHAAWDRSSVASISAATTGRSFASNTTNADGGDPNAAARAASRLVSTVIAPCAPIAASINISVSAGSSPGWQSRSIACRHAVTLAAASPDRPEIAVRTRSSKRVCPESARCGGLFMTKAIAAAILCVLSHFKPVAMWDNCVAR